MKLLKYITLGATLLSFSACDSFLDLKPISDETADNAYTRAAQIESALAGTYTTLHSDFYEWDEMIYNDVRSDNFYSGGDNPEIHSFDLLTVTAVNSKVDQDWSSLYNGIFKANNVLYRIDGVVDLEEERKAEIIGESKFLRGLFYFSLVKLWGGVPLITQPTLSTAPEDVNIPRSTEAEIYAQIEQDLIEAANALPETFVGSEAKTRATKGACYALLAKVYAQSKQWQKVVDAVREVDNSSAGYSLVSDYNSLFTGANYENEECIFMPNYIGGNIGNFASAMMLPPSITNDDWRKFGTPSVDLVNAFDAESDVVRKSAAILFEDITAWRDQYWSNVGENSTNLPFAYKWRNPMAWSSTDRQYLLRYADMLLVKAEALNELNDINGAAVEVNKVRNRVGLNNLTSDQMSSQEVMRNTILNERRLEFAQEGMRWEDLQRHGLLVTTMSNLKEFDKESNGFVNYNMNENKILLPIPQVEMNRNPNLEQNPGY
ncbi:RagB/SusD family nutrient uptake outer membrane protein [Flammeovirga yaeyamensis]|uniref:RagB/SusD family nutrient uptake outer membrane protein n=1 Tax=Flammeovirga yaeyamensis TaxID=367791 RepID=A0AAX1N4M0_9BACT|nr:RagB/SusD family nutrient uptake outer membrane protein [Flammeovirga yaeyamensis]MBB3700408.1 hypothetical protein [Flammeovirga yaeyamensis]NMF36966.1 RagB/SusD family nutrient uptake outer membrane protein [Flammeovirga yaeyamensis]QWG02489.1 RagB/SusD family nutrient uptake outer membrane protein [Flammeovirga yaeyamensis]